MNATCAPLCSLQHRHIADGLFWNTQERAGWYIPLFFDGFRDILRLKFLGIVGGNKVSDADCADYVARLPDDDELAEAKLALRQETKQKRAAMSAAAASAASGPSQAVEGTAAGPSQPRATGTPGDDESPALEEGAADDADEQQQPEDDGGGLTFEIDENPAAVSTTELLKKRRKHVVTKSSAKPRPIARKPTRLETLGMDVDEEQ